MSAAKQTPAITNEDILRELRALNEDWIRVSKALVERIEQLERRVKALEASR